MAIEREKADLSVYKFYIEFACKRYRRDIISTYKQLDSVMSRKVKVKLSLNHKSKSKVKNLKKKIPSKKIKGNQIVEVEEDSLEAKPPKEETKNGDVKGILKYPTDEVPKIMNVKFMENANYVPVQTEVDNQGNFFSKSYNFD